MSTKQTRRRFSSEFKLKVVLDALKERQSLAELSQKYEVSQVMISRWKSEYLEAAPRVFSKTKSEDTKSLEAANEKLYTEIGRQKIEIDFLKKFTRYWGNKSPRRFRVRWSEKTAQKFKKIKLLSYETTTSQVQCCL